VRAPFFEKGYIMKPVPCIVCGKVLEEAMSDTDNQPYKATTFVTYGHYGSTFFDPMDGSSIEINVCDDCLEKAKLDKKIVHYFEKKVTYYA
jgi:hypothetical protein